MKLRYLNFLFLLLIGASFYGCKTETNKRSDYLQVMKVHDEAMARMGKIYELKRTLGELVSGIQDSIKTDEIKAMIESLDKADEGMMDWMALFKIPETEDEEALNAYFAQEQKAVNTVSENINQAIQQAEVFLKQNKTQ